MLYCVECGCCSQLGTGWVATRCDDPDPDIALYCPPCAAAEFGYRPDVAANYVCAWEQLPIDPRCATDSRSAPIVQAASGPSGGAPSRHVTDGERMSLLLRRWRQWLSPAARRGRRAAHTDYATWAEAQREQHRLVAVGVRQ